MARPQDENKRQEIISCAKRLFSRQGFHNTSIADLTRETGLPVGTIYTYFGGKEELMLSIIENGWQDIQTRMSQAFQAATGLEERIQVLSGFFFGELLRDSDLINILLTEALELTGLSQKLDQLMAMVESLQAQANGLGWSQAAEAKAQDRAAVVVYFLGMLHAARLSPDGQLGYAVADLQDFMRQMVLRSLGSDRS
jgi:AcrR family transcriptional regulator